VKNVKTYEEALAEVCAMDGPLAARLSAYTNVLQHFERPYHDASEELIDSIKASRIGLNAPKIGQAMPDFMLPDQDGKLVQLSDLLSDASVVISFNRGHWCPYCELELDSFAAAHAHLAARGVTIVSILPDRRPYLQKMRERHGHVIRFLCDMDSSYALELGLVVWIGDRLRELMIADGLDLSRFQGNDMWFLPIPATFLVGSDGRVRAHYIDPDFRNRTEIEALLADI
jgi:peroxiredoxin